MLRTALDTADELACGDVLHSRFTALPGSATVGDVRPWCDESSHREMAFLADGDRLLGVLAVTDHLAGFCG